MYLNRAEERTRETLKRNGKQGDPDLFDRLYQLIILEEIAKSDWLPIQKKKENPDE